MDIQSSVELPHASPDALVRAYAEALAEILSQLIPYPADVIARERLAASVRSQSRRSITVEKIVINAVLAEITTVKAAGIDGMPAAVIAFLLSFGLFPTSVPAQVNEAFADLAGEIETARSMAQTERKSIVARNMTLTAAESEHFWPLYNRYRYEMSVLQDRQVAIITDFAAHYESLDDNEARRLLDEWLSYESDLIRLRTRYIKRFAKVLPGTKLARYFQVENKLDAVSNLKTASQVPLAQ